MIAGFFEWIGEFFGLIFDLLDVLLFSLFVNGLPWSLLIVLAIFVLIPVLLIRGIKRLFGGRRS